MGANVPTEEQNRAMKLYLDHLQSLKARLTLIDRITSGSLRIDHESIDTEFACLQLRKSLELIAFASVAAHRDIYARAHADFVEHRKPKGLLTNLGKLHPGFYPKPAQMFVWSDNPRRKQLAPIESGYLTQEDFVFLYDACSEALHQWNPFRTDPHVIDLRLPMAEWAKRIRTLLALHWIQLPGSQDVWVVQLHNEATGTAQAWFAASTPPPDDAAESDNPLPRKV